MPSSIGNSTLCSLGANFSSIELVNATNTLLSLSSTRVQGVRKEVIKTPMPDPAAPKSNPSSIYRLLYQTLLLIQ
ncbi:hypothetical protein CLAVI_001031 [Candidatus Clavichlamydia salmonicola]|uniref:hypothetical protein n=1 Tax=Candidatus Clavichlamydia salmonicola TaxID=469812 RepID=UPI001890D4A4|nr:hypothetical protein [Candidatus Clavichlamydia salmonicola]MBF5051387.1 hypothetical protein [Candidatus Clavichlamydia salmonicola]